MEPQSRATTSRSIDADESWSSGEGGTRLLLGPRGRDRFRRELTEDGITEETITACLAEVDAEVT
jgi:hypothetical protein